MADAVSTYTIYPQQTTGTSTSGSRRQVMSFTNLSDGTGESAVKKVDITTLVGPNAATVTHLSIVSIQYNVQGMQLEVYFDRTSPIPIARLQGYGKLCFRKSGGFVDSGTGATGSLMFTTAGQASNASYDIVIEFIKHTN